MSANPPRIHHFITQSWIKRFKDDTSALWSYDKKTGDIKTRSSKKIMQIFDLHTIDPDGADDTTLETEDLLKIDNDGAINMDAVLSGKLSSNTRDGLADFLAVQLLRDPERLFSYAISAQKFLTLLFVEVFSASDFVEFQKSFGDLITDTEYQNLHNMGIGQAAKEIAKLQIALERRGGLPEVPFTDLVKPSTGQDRVRDTLLSLDWTLIRAAPDSFVLGDTGVLFDAGTLGAGLRVPLSGNAALILCPTSSSARTTIDERDAYSYEPSSMNYEAAARSRRWIAGSKANLESLQSQLGGPILDGF